MIKLVTLLVIVSVVIFIELWLIHWAVGLFYPITYMQAFGISILCSILGAAFRSRK
jgi:hypothetical protein